MASVKEKNLWVLLSKLVLFQALNRARCFLLHLASIPIRHRSCGKGVVIGSRVHVMGWKNVCIGDFSQIGHDTIIQTNNIELGKSVLSIGTSSLIGAGNFFNIGKSVTIGDYFLSAPQCSFICSSHNLRPERPYVTTGTVNEDSISIGDNVFIGYGSMILGGVTIGHGCVIGAQSLVRESIPPFSIAVGSPAKVIKRYNFVMDKWERTIEAQDDKTAQRPDATEYKMMLARFTGLRLPMVVSSNFLSDF